MSPHLSRFLLLFVGVGTGLAFLTTTTFLIYLIIFKQIPFSWDFILLIGVFSIVGGILGWLANAVILKPIKQLRDLMKPVVAGNLTFQNPFPKSEGELTEIAAGVEYLTSHLKQSLLHLDQAKQYITAERNKVDIALSSIVDPVIAVDLERKIVLFNRAAEQITGFSAEQVKGKLIDQVIKLYEKNHEIPSQAYCPIKPAGFEGISFSTPQLKLVSLAANNGAWPNKEHIVNVTTGQIKEGASINLGCIITLHDMTNEKQLAEMQLDFVSMAAHELRTPLTSIKGYLSVFIDENKDKLSADQMMFLNRIGNSTQQLTSLVENLLNVSRIERGALALTLEPLDWLALAEQVVADLQVRAKEKNIELQFLAPPQALPRVNADKVRITEVLTNLVANAINYTPPQGKIKVWTEIKDKSLITHVQDNGPGIAPEIQHNLFKKFFRAGNKLVQGTKGTGLGLYISKAIIDMHHGQIWVESEVGKGSTFSFSIPIYEENTIPTSLFLN